MFLFYESVRPFCPIFFLAFTKKNNIENVFLLLQQFRRSTHFDRIGFDGRRARRQAAKIRCRKQRERNVAKELVLNTDSDPVSVCSTMLSLMKSFLVIVYFVILYLDSDRPSGSTWFLYDSLTFLIEKDVLRSNKSFVSISRRNSIKKKSPEMFHNRIKSRNYRQVNDKFNDLMNNL